MNPLITNLLTSQEPFAGGVANPFFMPQVAERFQQPAAPAVSQPAPAMPTAQPPAPTGGPGFHQPQPGPMQMQMHPGLAAMMQRIQQMFPQRFGNFLQSPWAGGAGFGGAGPVAPQAPHPMLPQRQTDQRFPLAG